MIQKRLEALEETWDPILASLYEVHELKQVISLHRASDSLHVKQT